MCDSVVAVVSDFCEQGFPVKDEAYDSAACDSEERETQEHVEKSVGGHSGALNLV